MIHELKIEPRYLERIKRGEKTAELRINDRDYQVGDTLHLYAFTNQGYYLLADNTASRYRPPEPQFICEITHVLQGVPGLKKGNVILSFKQITEPLNRDEIARVIDGAMQFGWINGQPNPYVLADTVIAHLLGGEQ